MSDISLEWGRDFTIGPDGDLAVVDGDQETRQRAERRVLTNSRRQLTNGSLIAPEYNGDPTYGASIRAAIGSSYGAQDLATMKETIQTALAQDAAIAPSPPPSVAIDTSNPGNLIVTMNYSSAYTGNALSSTLPTTPRAQAVPQTDAT